MTDIALPASEHDQRRHRTRRLEDRHIAADETIAQAQGDKNIAIAHYTLGALLYLEAVQKRKEDLFAAAHEELTKALGCRTEFSGRYL